MKKLRQTRSGVWSFGEGDARIEATIEASRFSVSDMLDYEAAAAEVGNDTIKAMRLLYFSVRDAVSSVSSVRRGDRAPEDCTIAELVEALSVEELAALHRWVTLGPDFLDSAPPSSTPQG